MRAQFDDLPEAQLIPNAEFDTTLRILRQAGETIAQPGAGRREMKP